MRAVGGGYRALVSAHVHLVVGDGGAKAAAAQQQLGAEEGAAQQRLNRVQLRRGGGRVGEGRRQLVLRAVGAHVHGERHLGERAGRRHAAQLGVAALGGEHLAERAGGGVLQAHLAGRRREAAAQQREHGAAGHAAAGGRAAGERLRHGDRVRRDQGGAVAGHVQLRDVGAGDQRAERAADLVGGGVDAGDRARLAGHARGVLLRVGAGERERVRGAGDGEVGARQASAVGGRGAGGAGHVLAGGGIAGGQHAVDAHTQLRQLLGGAQVLAVHGRDEAVCGGGGEAQGGRGDRRLRRRVDAGAGRLHSAAGAEGGALGDRLQEGPGGRGDGVGRRVQRDEERAREDAAVGDHHRAVEVEAGGEDLRELAVAGVHAHRLALGAAERQRKDARERGGGHLAVLGGGGGAGAQLRLVDGEQGALRVVGAAELDGEGGGGAGGVLALHAHLLHALEGLERLAHLGGGGLDGERLGGVAVELQRKVVARLVVGQRDQLRVVARLGGEAHLLHLGQRVDRHLGAGDAHRHGQRHVLLGVAAGAPVVHLQVVVLALDEVDGVGQLRLVPVRRGGRRR
mmetsp:Transcript_7309/g.22436  ORF Transcript_7309/g.22436 Transcript_7309/m.22436 type:complete len:570 (+) Transcript_7309:5454-7163(+)